MAHTLTVEIGLPLRFHLRLSRWLEIDASLSELLVRLPWIGELYLGGGFHTFQVWRQLPDT
jgi:hypothetical protein